MSTVGTMLRLARQLRGFQQTEAAKRLGIEQPLLSRVENGFVEVRDDMMLRAEQVYSVPREFFLLTDPIFGPPVSVHPMWRRKADVTARDLDAIVAELNIRLIHLRRLLEAADVVHTSDIPKLDVEDYGDPEKIAALVRAHWKVPRGPIRDLTLLAERAGALLAHSGMAGAAVSGVTFAVPGLPPLIVLNSDQPADRMRYSLSHELAHLVMHRFPSPTMEEEANSFASALLMPAADIRPFFLGRRVDLALLASLKPEWKVSMQALLMRARNLDFVTANQAQYLWKQINIRRMRLREPPELDFPHETPTVIPTIVRLHMDSLGYSTAELARLLHIYEADLGHYYDVRGKPDAPKPRLTILR
jgi:Zn-dependent peptidase ImmA (M78 family)